MFKIWLIGVAISFCYSIIATIIKRKKLKKAVAEAATELNISEDNTILLAGCLMILSNAAWPITAPLRLIVWLVKKLIGKNDD